MFYQVLVFDITSIPFTYFKIYSLLRINHWRDISISCLPSTSKDNFSCQVRRGPSTIRDRSVYKIWIDLTYVCVYRRCWCCTQYIDKEKYSPCILLPLHMFNKRRKQKEQFFVISSLRCLCVSFFVIALLVYFICFEFFVSYYKRTNFPWILKAYH